MDLSTIPLDDLVTELERRRAIIENIPPRCAGLTPRIQTIVAAVAEAWDIPIVHLWKNTSSPNISEPRLAAMVILRKHAGLTLACVGDIFRKDRSAVSHAVSTHTGRLTQTRYRVRYQQVVDTITKLTTH